MKFQVSTYYALIAMMEVTAQPDVPVSATEIALRYGLPLSHLAKVMRSLGRAGLVVASRGIGGGYRLADPAQPTTLYDVISLFEPTAQDTVPELPFISSTLRGESLGALLGEIRGVQRGILTSTTFQTLIKLSEYSDRDQIVRIPGPG